MGPTHLISLVYSINKLRARGTPGETYGGGVDRLYLYISWRHSGNCSKERRENERIKDYGEVSDGEKKIEMSGGQAGRRGKNNDELEKHFHHLLWLHLERENKNEAVF